MSVAERTETGANAMEGNGNSSTRSESLEQLAPALCKAQAQLKHAKQDSENTFHKSKYANLSSCWDAIQKPFTDNGLSIVQLPCSEEDRVGCETMLIHSSGEWIKSRFLVPVDKRGAHGAMSALTYCRRGSLSAMCGIVSDPDDDGNAADESPNDTPPKTKRKPKSGEKREPLKGILDPLLFAKIDEALQAVSSNVEMLTYLPLISERLAQGLLRPTEARSLFGLAIKQCDRLVKSGAMSEPNFDECQKEANRLRDSIPVNDTEKQAGEVF